MAVAESILVHFLVRLVPNFDCESAPPFRETCNQLRENRVRCGIDPAMRGVGLSVPKPAWRGGGKVSGDKIATSSFDFRLAQGCCRWYFDPNASNLFDRGALR
jgi:hypothetical protein